jgi:lipopolysaccharide heptosyltransferase I
LKILILKPSSLGDVVHALPVLRLLKSHFPKGEIYWWLDLSLMPLLEKDPDLAGIIPFQRKRWAGLRRWPEIAASLRALRRHRFDWAIDLQGLARSSLFAWLANPGLTAGLDNPREGAREGARALYDIIPPRAPAHTHAVDRYLAVLPALGVPVHRNFVWLPPRPEYAAQVEEKWRPAGSDWVALLPGGRWSNKRWPVKNYVALVKLMRQTPGVKFVILGNQEEHALGQTIAATDPARCLNLAGLTSMMEMIEWLRLCRLVVTNDTGPMHVAAALNRPVVAVFGPTDPSSTGPYGQIGNVLQNDRLPCVPCLRPDCHYREPLACLHSITPEVVFAKARRAMGAGELSSQPALSFL